jgi:hypothetical protein
VYVSAIITFDGVASFFGRVEVVVATSSAHFSKELAQVHMLPSGKALTLS